MKRQERRRKCRSGSERDPFRIVAACLAGGFALAAGALVLDFSASPKPAAPHVHNPALVRPIVSSSHGASAVVGRFVCSGTSHDKTELAACECPTAIEEKQMIERELAAGHKPHHVIRMVQSRYGGLKPEGTL